MYSKPALRRGSSSPPPSSTSSFSPSSLSDAEYFGSLGENELSSLHGSSHSEYTSCFTCLTTFHITFLTRHPLLAVPICNPCKQFYSSQPWKLYPEISFFDRCRSCAKDNFKLIQCRRSNCYNAFCVNCLEKNLGGILQYNQSSWNCLTCDTSQILSAQSKYFSIFNYWREKHDNKLYLDPITKSFTSSKEVQAEYKESLFWEYELWKKHCEKDPKPSSSAVKETGHKLLNIHRSALKKIKHIILDLKTDMNAIPCASKESIEEDDDEISICSSTISKISASPCVKIQYNSSANNDITNKSNLKSTKVSQSSLNKTNVSDDNRETCKKTTKTIHSESEKAESDDARSRKSTNEPKEPLNNSIPNENTSIVHEISKKELKVSLEPVNVSILKELKKNGYIKMSKLHKTKFDSEYAAIVRLCNFKNINSHKNKIDSPTKGKSLMTSLKTQDGKSKEKEALDIEEIELDDSDESDNEIQISSSLSKISNNRATILSSSSSSSSDDDDDDIISLCTENEGNNQKVPENKKVKSLDRKLVKRKHESLPNFMTMSLEKRSNGKRIYSSSSDDDTDEEKKPKSKRRKMESLSTDSDGNSIEKDHKMSSDSSSSMKMSDESNGSNTSGRESPPFYKTKKVKRKKGIKKNSDSTAEDNPNNKGRKKIHKIIKDHKLSEMSKEAAEIERERRKRMEEKLKLYQKEFVDSVKSSKTLQDLILDFDAETKGVRVEVDRELVKELKPHQADGIKFMWNAIFESKDDILNNRYPGGAILAHCMGLGKTLQTIALIHTVLKNFPEHITRVLVICPVNTVKNWKDEFDKWCKGSLVLDVHEICGDKGNEDRTDRLNYWLDKGGVLIIGYDMFRNLTTGMSRKLNSRQKDIILRSLVDPGPHLVICDEGHVLKNRNSALNKSINKIGTKRRIILTGTPLQNNLSEYFAMVNFVKPNLLGSYKEFKNRFVNPIQNGQHSDSTDHDVRVMKKRSFILGDLLKGCLQRLDYSVLVPYLQPKYEYVLCINLSNLQEKLYKYYLENFARGGHVVGGGKMEGGKMGGLFNDVTVLSQIWNHPIVLLSAKERNAMKNLINDDEEDMNQFIDDRSTEEATSSSSDSDIEIIEQKNQVITRQIKKETGTTLLDGIESQQSSSSNDWWSQFLETEEELQDISNSPKMILLLEILKNADILGDKTLVFSQSLLSLDMIETFLARMDEYHHEQDVEKIPECLKPFIRPWKQGKNYFRMDGSTPPQVRKKCCNYFNKSSNTEMKLFLISTKAGGLGINLVAANRVIIFDASWNPAHDLQSIFRVYRFGQNKPVYIYRFLAKGTMEEKIYDRQVTKQSLSARVVDEQQIERHFSMSELAELYTFKDQDSNEERPVPKVPIDNVLAEILSKHPDKIWKYHDHDSLLKNQVDENLTEDERKTAWEEYENERKGILMSTNLTPPNINTSLIPMSSMDMKALYQVKETYGRQLKHNNTSLTPLPSTDEGIFRHITEVYRQQNPHLSDDVITMAARQYILQVQARSKAVHGLFSPNVQGNQIPSTSKGSIQNLNSNINVSVAGGGGSAPTENKRISVINIKSVPKENNGGKTVNNNKSVPKENNGGKPVNNNKSVPKENNGGKPVNNNKSVPKENNGGKPVNNNKSVPIENDGKGNLVNNNKSVPIENNGGKLVNIQNVVIEENGVNPKNNELSK